LKIAWHTDIRVLREYQNNEEFFLWKNSTHKKTAKRFFYLRHGSRGYDPSMTVKPKKAKGVSI